MLQAAAIATSMAPATPAAIVFVAAAATAAAAAILLRPALRLALG
jgi:hypothetical protein